MLKHYDDVDAWTERLRQSVAGGINLVAQTKGQEEAELLALRLRD